MPLDQPNNPCLDIADLVDLDRYPLHDPDDVRLRAVVQRVREDLTREGCARLADFIHPARQEALRAETTRLATRAQTIPSQFTPYVGSADESFPPEHPRRRLQTASNSFVTRDRIPADSPLNVLYRHPDVKRFLAACLGKPEIHEFADPIRGLVINVMQEGTTLPWHFDANEFIVSLMTRPADNGGVFEYCPHIRAPGAENYGTVQAVMDGARGPVRTLKLKVGDLQLFHGRYSLHRVTEARGERHSVLFGYAEEPGFIGTVESTRRAYGRVTQAHIDADKRRHHDGLAD